MSKLLVPFPFFGGKRSIADNVWQKFGNPVQYIEPFCGSAAVLLAAPQIAPLEVVGDLNGFIANFWRAVKHDAADVANWADYPVSHIDLGARHSWLVAQRERIGLELQDPDWPGDSKVAGWWLWGQCCWIGSGWCDWFRHVPHVSNAGLGVQAIGQVPHVSNPGMGVQAIGRIPHVSNAGLGVQAIGQVPHVSNPGMGRGELWTSTGRTAMHWLRKIANRLERVRIVHGNWSRCLNNNYGGDETAIFLDPPYRSYEKVYGNASPVADAVEAWARDNSHLRVAICGHRLDYDLPGWDVSEWSRPSLTYSGSTTTDKECIWYSPPCLKIANEPKQKSWLEAEWS